MKRKASSMAKRLICVLLCVALLPLAKVSAAGFNDAFKALEAIAKTGEHSTYDDPDWGRFHFYDYTTQLNGSEFSISFQTGTSPEIEDMVILSKWRSGRGDAYCHTVMYLFYGQNYSIEFGRYSMSEYESGKTDSYGFYDGEANVFWDSNTSLDDDLELYGFSAKVSESKFKSDFKKDIKDILEFLDKSLRSKDSKLSIQDVFKNIPPKSVHTAGKSWTEKAETCTVDGSMGYQCSVCGAKYYEPIPAHHNWEVTRVDVAATEEHGSGEYTCSRCGEKKTEAICISSDFTDMPAYDNWAHPGIDWAVYNHITNGVSATSFGPGRGCTRGQVVTFLWRAAGNPEPEKLQTPFQDLKPGAFYEKAVAWAVENKITSGTSATQFSPDATCTRGQIVTFLWRFKGTPEVSTTETHFTDVKIGAFYEKAVAWAEATGVTAGTTRTTFSPGNTCTRAQVVTFLYRAQKDGTGPIELKALVGVAMPTKDLQRWHQDGELMQKLLKEAGYDVDLQYASNSVSKQVSQIEKMVDSGAKVIIVAAIDGYALSGALAKAKAAGVKVIAYDRLIYGSNAVSYYATFNNWRVGELQGEFIESALDLKNAGTKTFNIEFITGDPGDNNINFFYDGAMSVLRKYLDSGVLVCQSGQTEKMDVATEGWSAENAQNRFENILSTYYANRQLDAVMASNDSTAQGVAAALASSYSNDVYPIITGQDCDIISTMNMRQGRQAMSVFKDTRDLAAKTVEMADAIIKGAEVPVNDTKTYDNGAGIIPSFLCEPRVCTVDNIQELLIDSGYYTWEDISPR